MTTYCDITKYIVTNNKEQIKSIKKHINGY